MRRFLTLVFLLIFTIPFGVSISGCAKKTPVVYCDAGDSGPVVGQVDTITLAPQIYGISLNQTQIGQVGTPTAKDCKGTAETVSAYTYATFDSNGKPDMTIADVQPNTGKLCAGTWNRNTGGGIPDFTTCMPTGKSGIAYVVVSGGGASSNSLPIFVHPVVTSVVLGPLSTNCLLDPATNCSPAAFTTTVNTCTVDPGTGCCTTPVVTSGAAGVANGCISQGVTSQLAARIYQGADTTLPANNISCEVGHLTYAAQPATVVNIDQNGIASALSPGSALITATISQAGSSAGAFSTCPPTSIQLSIPLVTGSNVVVNPNNTQPINALVMDKNNTILTSVPLEFVSTTPTTIPAATSGSVTPLFPGAAAITAICQPPACNPSPIDQIGLNGNGKPITSNEITITAPGHNSTDLYIGSTQSLYIVPIDFTTSLPGSPVRLPYVPNSMIINNAGTSIYMGSANELMTYSTSSNSVTAQDATVTGTVLAVSPDGTTLVMTDPSRQLVYLYTTSGTVQTTYGGVATHAEFTPDSQTVYITMGDVTTPATPTTPAVVTPNTQLLVHSVFTGWYVTNSAQPTPNLAVTVPSVGAFFSGSVTTARGYCPITTASTNTDGQITTTNVFYPDAGVADPVSDVLAATNDGLHILGATATPAATLTDLFLTNPAGNGLPVGACPDTGLKFTANPVLNSALPGITATAVTGVDPASDSTIAFVTYTGTGGTLPSYTPSATGAGGTLGTISLSTAVGTPTAPVAGVFSSDNFTFYVGTSGDNAVHLITKGTNGYQDTTAPITPKLPDVNGNTVTPNLLVQKPRLATS
jgi:hypothetical protein